jgi:hypothetical protein
MEQLWIVIFVLQYQMVPLHREGTYFFVSEPIESVKELTSDTSDELARENPVGRVPTVPEYNGGPVLSRIVFVVGSELGSEVLSSVLCPIIMFDDLNRVSVIT